MTTRISRVVPAILTDNAQTLFNMVRQAETFTNYVQFDIMDGQFVPSRSITAADLAQVSIRFKWEAHLMVKRPLDYLADFKKAGAGKVIFHYESASPPMDVIYLAKQFGLGIGIALNPETPISAILPLAKQLDNVLLMTVHPGFYGSKFLPEVMNKVTKLRTSLPETRIGVDGGISESNIVSVASSGVDDICVGSAIFLNHDPAKSFHHLQAMAEEASLKKPAGK